MARFECNICEEIVIEASEPSKCPHCGTESPGWTRKRLPPVMLRHGDQTFVVYQDRKAFGRDQFRVFGRDIYKYAAAIQFEIIAGDEDWQVRGIAGNPTPTQVNSIDLADRIEKIATGDQIQVGPLKLDVEVKM